MGHLAVMAQWT